MLSIFFFISFFITPLLGMDQLERVRPRPPKPTAVKSCSARRTPAAAAESSSSSSLSTTSSSALSAVEMPRQDTALTTTSLDSSLPEQGVSDHMAMDGHSEVSSAHVALIALPQFPATEQNNREVIQEKNRELAGQNRDEDERIRQLKAIFATFNGLMRADLHTTLQTLLHGLSQRLDDQEAVIATQARDATQSLHELNELRKVIAEKNLEETRLQQCLAVLNENLVQEKKSGYALHERVEELQKQIVELETRIQSQNAQLLKYKALAQSLMDIDNVSPASSIQ